jgi:hypothetical protein
MEYQLDKLIEQENALRLLPPGRRSAYGLPGEEVAWEGFSIPGPSDLNRDPIPGNP